MGDSTEMTIEFLRARLLSERSVSRAARQRADQLAKRVIELEEQLRIVTTQRKKAEKAASEVLAILETRGIGDLSEGIDSNSDREAACDDTQREYESSAASRLERSEVDDGFSGSEPEVSPSQGRSLSWKSHGGSSGSHDKRTAKQIRQRQRRRTFLLHLQSSSKHQSGKSCRKIKRKDTGSPADSETHKPTLLDDQGNGGIACSKSHDDEPDASMITSRGVMEDVVVVTSDFHHVDDHSRQTEVHPCANGSERDEEMERVLEKQAKFIGQFQAEETAQREWEEKYNQSKTSTLVNNEPGNQSHVAVSSSKPKKEVSKLADKTPVFGNDAIPRPLHTSGNGEATVEGLSGSEKNNDRSDEASDTTFSNGSVPRETKNNSHESTVSAPENYGTIRNRNQNEVKPRDVPDGYPSNSTLNPHGQQKYRQLPQEHGNKLGNVLEALQRAKLSLSQELKKLPSSSQGTLSVVTPTNSQTRATESLNIPIGSADLFRLPTDSYPRAQLSLPELNGARSSLLPDRPDVGYGYQHSNTTSYMEIGPRFVRSREYIDNYSNMYSRASSDLSAERVSLRGEFSKSYSDSRNRMPRGDGYNLYGDHQTRFL
ncbi:uncharacterized protein A4U43_C10F17320 [Asparagus officinalis]|uniref:Uncharacterized protein n=1 Tax=Asparagus officinalis TaxID=4686 RepID=A0A5P1E3P4_ASPOF|nr:uncharacterized protein LOC109825025 [Asparagus officinalis]ONK57170.1 uncharacterized protein A4U43_C10F17320 [Asparagus officinalis]